MRSALSIGTLAIALVLFTAAGCSYPDGAPPEGVVAEVVNEVDSAEARQVVDRFMGAVTAGDMDSAGSLLVGRALETSRALAGASSVEMLSVTEIPGAGGENRSIHAFDVECDVSYPDNNTLGESGVYVYRMVVVPTEAGLRIESMGPWGGAGQ